MLVLLLLVYNSTFRSMSQEYKLNWSLLNFLINIKSIGWLDIRIFYFELSNRSVDIGEADNASRISKFD